MVPFPTRNQGGGGLSSNVTSSQHEAYMDTKPAGLVLLSFHTERNAG